MLTEAQRRYANARDRVRDTLIDPLSELIAANSALHEEAQSKIIDLKDGIRICLEAERRRQENLRPGAPASQYTAQRIAMLEGLLQ